MPISGKTRLAGLFGYPVGHTLSPAMHNAAFACLGLDWVYLPFAVPPANLAEGIAGVRALNLAGVNLTVPHKETVLPLLDNLAPGARAIGAVNTVVNRDGVLTGHNTDADGFLRALQEEAGFHPRGRTVLILGAGGAARAVAVGCALAGAREIWVANRTLDRGAALAAHVDGLAGVRARGICWTGAPDLEPVVDRADLVVQATSQGMYPRSGESPAFPFAALRRGTYVTDVVYNPAETAFLSAARQCGAQVLGGLEMLLYQGAMAFSLWTGHPAPVGVMRAALAEGLSLQV
ncbi:MAG TPA: shikimate dehydrogenase [Spirochaetia bacterium]|nr:shikimate dehydrogenase [Spirochaetia bacterium]